MAVGNPMQTAFNAGLWGPLLDGRVEHARYRNACSELVNFIPTLQGPAVKRPGTRYIAPAKYNDKMARFQRFEFSQVQAYVLEFGDLYMRVHRNSATVLNASQAMTAAPTAANPVEITITGHGYSNGQTVFITGTGMPTINDRFFEVANVTANTFELLNEDRTGSATGTGGTAASVFELVTTYSEADVSDLQFEQSNDVLYVAHELYAPMKFSRTSDIVWTRTEIEGGEPPFDAENLNESITIQASAGTGAAVVLTASGGSPFSADMVGGFIKLRERYASENPKWLPVSSSGNIKTGFAVNDRLYNDARVYQVLSTAALTGNNPPVHEEGTFDDGSAWTYKYINDGYGYAKITGYTSGTQITVDVDTAGVEFPASVVAAGTFRWAIGAWSPAYGYPRAVAFFQDRLMWGGTTNSPQGIWGSASGDYEDYRFEGENAKGLFFVLNSRRQNGVEWMRGEKILFIGTTGGEFTLDGGQNDTALSKENFRLRPRSFYGSREGSAAIQIDNTIIFTQRAGRKVHEILYDFDTDQFIAPDLTAFSEEVLDGLVKGMADHHEPWRGVFPWMEDGTWASMTYIREEEVNAWASHVLGGTNAKVLSSASIPHPDGDEDQLWLLTERTVNGSTRRSVEIMEKRWEVADAIEDAFYVDSGLTFSSSVQSAVSVIQVRSFGIIVSTQFTGVTHGLTTGDLIQIVSMPQYLSVEGNVYSVIVIAPTIFSIHDLDTGLEITDEWSLSFPAPATFKAKTKNLIGLDHLEGESVEILADGSPQPSKVVSGGAITIDTAAFKAQIGLGYEGRLKTMRFETGGRAGVAQGKTKRANKLVIRAYQTMAGLFYGGDFDLMEEVFFMTDGYPMDTPLALLDGDSERLNMPTGYDKDGKIAIKHDSPGPCHILALLPMFKTQEGG